MIYLQKQKQNSRLPLICIGLVLMGAIAYLLLYMAGVKGLAVFAWAGLLAGMVPALWRERARVYRIIAIAVAAALVISLILFHGQILDGFALIMNRLHGIAERAQAYIYDRYEVGESGQVNENLCQQIAVTWCAVTVGLLITIPTERFRPWIQTGLAAAAMLIFAYYGLLPQSVGIAVLTGALILIAGGMRIRSLLPILIIGAVFFMTVLAVDPGENKAVSRADEQLRDQLAFQTAQLSGQQMMEEQIEEEQQAGGGGGLTELLEDNPLTKNIRLKVFLLLTLIILLILFVPAVIRDRLERKRRKIREGIDSPDPRCAVCALFPYALRWLKAYGLQTGNRPFASLCPQVRMLITDEYGDAYDKMVELWKEAAYSDEEITEEKRQEMSDFVDQTIIQTVSGMNWRQKANVRFRLAL